MNEDKKEIVKETVKDTSSVSMSELRQILAEQAQVNAETLSTVIQELKKPTVLEQKELDRQTEELLAKNAERKDNAGDQLRLIADKRFVQSTCSHKHSNTGQSHCVLIFEKNSPGYILCQKNQCKIRPGPAPKNYNGTDMYDTALFNRLLQEMPSNEMFG